MRVVTLILGFKYVQLTATVRVVTCALLLVVHKLQLDTGVCCTD
jgi:hypothetical protein